MAGVQSFAEWLRDRLGEREMSHRRLAREVGVSGVTVGKWVAGTDYPTRDKLAPIAEALGVQVHDAWNAYTELPPPPYSDVTLARLLGLPQDLNWDEIVLMRHLFQAVRAYERDKGARDVRSMG